MDNIYTVMQEYLDSTVPYKPEPLWAQIEQDEIRLSRSPQPAARRRLVRYAHILHELQQRERLSAFRCGLLLGLRMMADAQQEATR